MLSVIEKLITPNSKINVACCSAIVHLQISSVQNGVCPNKPELSHSISICRTVGLNSLETFPHFFQECLVEDRNLTTMYCPSPRLKKSGVAGENYFRLGIAFDGFEDYLRLPESVANLTLHDDPNVTEWSETRHFTYPFNQVIQITVCSTVKPFSFSPS